MTGYINQWKCRINERPGTWWLNVYLFRDGPNGSTVILYPKEEGNVEKTVEYGAYDIEPSIVLSHDQLAALSVELSAQNIKTRETSFTEGKLEATERHLEDMRSLVFKKK
jgi:hypothetical protein